MLTSRLTSSPLAFVRTAVLTTATIASSWYCLAISNAQGQGLLGMKRQAANFAKICKEDYDHFCSGVQRGGGRVIACLSANAAKLSPACRDALPAAQNLAARAAARNAGSK